VKATLLLLAVAVLAWAAWVSPPAPHPAPSPRPHSARVPPLSSNPSSSSSSPPARGGTGRWRLVFDDEFNGSALDLAKWQPNWLGTGPEAVTPPVTRYDLNCVSPDDVSEANGMLDLAAVARTCTTASGRTYSYASGLVNTKRTFTFTYGYLAARIYVPTSPNGRPANYAAFWANGLGHWPLSGELDIMEVLSGCGPGVAFHFHAGFQTPGACAPKEDSSGWHVFGADWQPGVITFYIDGRQVGEVRQGVTSKPMYLILNNSVNPVYGGPPYTPTHLLVDYVRLWQ
jgi:beta-glucanase (GH16 family)